MDNDITQNDTDKPLTLVETARWMSLLTAIDHIEKHCEEKNKNFNDEILKPIPIKHFIEEKHRYILNSLTREQE